MRNKFSLWPLSFAMASQVLALPPILAPIRRPSCDLLGTVISGDNRPLHEIAEIPILNQSSARIRIKTLYSREEINRILGAADFPNDVRRAVSHLSSSDHSSEEKANLWQLFVGVLENRHSEWTSDPRRGQDRSYVFQGGKGEALVIDPNGKIFRGENFFVGEGVLWVPNYDPPLRQITPAGR